MIRRRLVLGIVAVVVVISGAAGRLALDTLRDRQMNDVEEELRAADRQAADYLASLQAAQGPPPLERIYEPFPYVMRRVAYMLVTTDGTVLWAFPSGTTPAPDPLPDIGELPPSGQMATVGSEGEDGPRFRIMTREVGNSLVVVMGSPLAAADETLASVTEILLVSGAIALVAVAAAVWLTLRRGLRPIEQMVVTARNIADGDLSQRAPTGPARGEVAQLGAALNTMLDQVQEAVEVKVASEAQMRRFVADASHELRTPLTSIRGYAELYRRGATDPTDVALGMARIEHEAVRMTGLVDDLLLLARLDQGRPLACDPVDLVTIVGDAAQAAALTEPSRPMTVLLPDRPVTLDGDGDRLRQIVDNLLSNVRTHTDLRTPVEVSLTATDGRARVVVSDDGPGMTAEHAGRVFERFYRADARRPGSGIGLSIVAELADAHGGSVALDTEPGGGTTVAVTLPLRSRPALATAAAGGGAAPSEG
jgi:two-component system OmpR family sensor kinase